MDDVDGAQSEGAFCAWLVGTASRAVRGRLGEASLPDAKATETVAVPIPNCFPSGIAEGAAIGLQSGQDGGEVLFVGAPALD